MNACGRGQRRRPLQRELIQSQMTPPPFQRRSTRWQGGEDRAQEGGAGCPSVRLPPFQQGPGPAIAGFVCPFAPWFLEVGCALAAAHRAIRLSATVAFGPWRTFFWHARVYQVYYVGEYIIMSLRLPCDSRHTINISAHIHGTRAAGARRFRANTTAVFPLPWRGLLPPRPGLTSRQYEYMIDAGQRARAWAWTWTGGHSTWPDFRFQASLG